MKRQRLLHALSEIEPEFVTQAAPVKKKLPRWGKLLTTAACICLVLLSAAELIDRYEWFHAGCSANPGIIVGDTYYFSYMGDGIYSYTPGEGTKKELSTFWYEDWQVNDYGIYYKQDHSVYVKVHATGKTDHLYCADLIKYTHISFTLDSDGSVIVTQYNKHRDMQDEVRIDGITGSVIETVTPATAYDDIFRDRVIAYSDSHFTVGDRTVTLTVTGKEHRFTLCENDINLLPEDVTVGQYPKFYGDRVWFSVSGNSGEDWSWFIVSPDGEDRLLTLPSGYFDTATNDYLFYTTNWSDEVWCMDYHTLERWKLVLDTPSDDLYAMVTDGEWFYTCAPWSEEQTLWKLIYENERPIALKLVQDSVAPHDH